MDKLNKNTGLENFEICTGLKDLLLLEIQVMYMCFIVFWIRFTLPLYDSN